MALEVQWTSVQRGPEDTIHSANSYNYPVDSYRRLFSE